MHHAAARAAGSVLECCHWLRTSVMRADTRREMRYAAVGFDLLTALLDYVVPVRGRRGRPRARMRWHAASQSLLRGKAYRPFEDIVREAASGVGIDRPQADELLKRWGESEPWPDVPDVLAHSSSYTRFIVTNCSERLGALRGRTRWARSIS